MFMCKLEKALRFHQDDVKPSITAAWLQFRTLINLHLAKKTQD